MSAAVRHIAHLDLRFDQKPWTFADERRAEIADHFAALQRRNPAVWNGRVLLLHDHAFDGGSFRGSFLETDFAGFDAWRKWGRPDRSVTDCFAAAAVVSADGGWLLGVMSEFTANAGQTYFPCGTPDPGDVVDGRVDFEGSFRRELREETGLDAGEFAVEPGWSVVDDGDRLAMIRVLRSTQPADALRARIVERLAQEKQPELSDIRVIRRPSDLDERVLPFVGIFLRHRFG